MLFHKIKYFLEIAELKSFTKAAETFNISQPALSKQMKLLEEELGFPLFNRSVRGVDLTDKGQSLYQDLKPLFGQIERTIHNYRDHDQIRFGSTPMISSYFIHRHYDKLVQTNFHVTTIKDDSRDLLPLLEADEIDAAIIQDEPSSSNLYSKFLFRDNFLAAVPLTSNLASLEEVTMEQCMEKTQIIPPEGSLTSQLKRIMEQKQFKGEVIETHYHAMAGLVSLGLGIAYLPEIMVQQIEYKGVVFLPIKGQPLARDMYLYAVTLPILEFLSDKLTK
ncbi:LysR family transcriptional regulator [Halobacillus sp. K22]|uniref:LysR family transcriptional regulator n=1 Tax=Halobacillus sp. K22 TaxID=3457431 RepID=UPI003FCDC484